MSNLVNHARRELTRIYGPEVDWDPDDIDTKMCNHILHMVEEFADEGHSGSSASYALWVLERLLQFKPLTPITNDPDEWMEVFDDDRGRPVYQNRRDGEAFSHDGGRTYYLLSERRHGWRAKLLGRHKFHTSEGARGEEARDGGQG